MNAIEILRAASRSVPNEDYVQFMAAVDAVAEVIEAVRGGVETRTHNGFVMRYDEVQADRLAAALAAVGVQS